MQYRALYRQYRPDTFDQVVGQDPVTRTLKNQVRSGRIAHAYLFCGPRGVGKTTAARVFARAINCANPQDGEPCGDCEICRTLKLEASLDVVEIDAASNNRVDEVRDLREWVKYPPSIGRYKVYIIDEVHMLTAGAFNALLKTLEEPPAHVVFILATTEAHKLPATIVSRCQKFDFKRIASRVIARHLHDVTVRAGARFSDEACDLIARISDGGMRDALSVADQCIGFSGGEVDLSVVEAVVGTEDSSFFIELSEDMLSGNPDRALILLGKALDGGKDAGVLARDLTNCLRSMLLCKTLRDPASVLEIPEETVRAYRQSAEKFGSARMLRAAEMLLALQDRLRYSPQPRVLVEMTVLRVACPEADLDAQALLLRVEKLEESLARGLPAAPMTSESTPKPAAKPAAQPPPEDLPEPARQPETPKDALSGAKIWQALLEKMKKENIPLYSALMGASYRGIEKGKLHIALPPEQGFYEKVLNMPNHRQSLEQALLKIAGEPCGVEVHCGSRPAAEQAGAEEPGDLVRRSIELFGRDRVRVEE